MPAFCFILLFSLLILPRTRGAASPAGGETLATPQASRLFLEMYNSIWPSLYTTVAEAEWKGSTDVTDEHTGLRIGANQARAVFEGSPYIIQTTRWLLERKGELDDLTVRQLEAVLYNAASFPGTIPEVVTQRVQAEARQSAVQDGFVFRLGQTNDPASKVLTANEISDILVKSTDLEERRRVWEASKEIGAPLKPGLIELQRLRNRVAREMGFSSFFDLQVADYGMSVREMRELTERLNAELQPLYVELHAWTRRELAKRFGAEEPKLIPAHWLPNRWGQGWPGLVEDADFDGWFASKTPEWIVQQSEAFYVSLGYPKLPQVFWEKSDLYELPPDAKRKKNTHASAWHMNLENDVRSLMSVQNNFYWWGTSHHELGHIYYYLAYSRPEVPVTLRGGSNRAFHEGVGDLIGMAAGQLPYLKQIGLAPASAKIDTIQALLASALDHDVVFIPWSAGVMTAWEHDFYEQELPPGQLNKRWWDHVARYQGIAPPSPRGEEFCDAATKTHINDDPAQYYDYALATVIKHQLHLHIARKILKQEPHDCNYYGNKQAGEFIWNILKVGKTKDWRAVLREATGEEISAKPMLEYYEPLLKWLREQNRGKAVGWR